MDLLLGQTVSTRDGNFGTITDILVDQNGWTVEHLVVRPFDDELVTKLVPIWLVESAGSQPVVGLTTSYAMRLEMVPLGGLVSIAAEPLVESKGGVQATEVVSAASLGDATIAGLCVRSADGDAVGRVCGVSVTNRHLEAVLVRSTEAGGERLAPIPMIDVDAIEAHQIKLHVTRTRADQLSVSDVATRSSARQRNFERETIHAARRRGLPLGSRAWPTWQRQREY